MKRCNIILNVEVPDAFDPYSFGESELFPFASSVDAEKELAVAKAYLEVYIRRFGGHLVEQSEGFYMTPAPYISYFSMEAYESDVNRFQRRAVEQERNRSENYRNELEKMAWEKSEREIVIKEMERQFDKLVKENQELRGTLDARLCTVSPTGRPYLTFQTRDKWMTARQKILDAEHRTALNNTVEALNSRLATTENVREVEAITEALAKIFESIKEN